MSLLHIHFNKIKAHFKQVLALTLSFTCLSISAQASASKEAAPEQIKLNPITLRQHLIDNNLSVIKALNRVHDAKDQVNIARGNLLPSIGLGALLNTAGSPSFLLSSVTYLLPFLLPSNWFNYYQQKDLFEAELISFRILELNTYSSALSLYYTLLGDIETQQIYKQQAEDLAQIHEIKLKQSDMIGSTNEDLLDTQSQMQLAQIRSSQLEQLVVTEIASLRSALALPVSTQIDPEFVPLPASTWENNTIQQAIDETTRVGIEKKQIDFLMEAAKHAKWSKVFGFINGSSLSSQSKGGQNASFTENLNATGSMNIGFSYYPTIKMSERDIQEIQLLHKDLLSENTRLMETAIQNITKAKNQYTLATEAESAKQQVYLIKLKKYDLGLVSLLPVLVARASMAEASVARVKAQLSLNLQRITLHRSMLTDQFEQIQGCRIERPEDADHTNKLSLFFKKLFKRSPTSHKALDEVCKQQQN